MATLIPAHQISPGQIIELDGETFPVERVSSDSLTTMVSKYPAPMAGNWLPLRRTKLVKVLGHFNPESI